MRKIILAAGMLSMAMLAMAQEPTLTVTVSTDSVLLGNHFELKFTIENVNGKGFQAPDLHEFIVLSGPNTSSSISIINGEMSQSSSYTWYLQPPEIGVYTIKPGYFTSEDIALETPPIDIIVVPNPDGIIQRPHAADRRISEESKAISPKEETPTRPRKKF